MDEAENVNDDEDMIESFNDDKNAKTCFFCDRISFKKSGRYIYCRQIKKVDAFLAKIKTKATELNDFEMLQRISRVLNCKTLCYDGNCSLDYHAKFRIHTQRPATNDWANTRDFNKIARQALIQYIYDQVVNHNRVLSFSYLKAWYKEFLRDFYEMQGVDCTNLFSTAFMQSHILLHLKNEVKIVHISQKLYVISIQRDIETIHDEEIREIFFQKMQEFALEFREHVFKIEKNPLPDFVDSEILK